MVKSNYIIELKNITKSFPDKVVLDDVSLSVKRGEFLTILGPSGCGKTTLLRLLAGFNTATKGEISIDGEVMTNVPPHMRPVNTVFQRYALFPNYNVYDNIAFGLKLKKVDKREIEQRVKRALKMVGMTDYEHRDVHSLSGGQQQRVAIARAVVANPEIILADEPTGNLDSKHGIEVMELLQQLNGEGTTIVMVTHSTRDAAYAHRTVNIFDGVVVSESEKQNV